MTKVYEVGEFNFPNPFIREDEEVRPIGAPTDILGNVLWLDGQDAGTFIVTGSDIDQWSDKSGNSNHATASGTDRPDKVSYLGFEAADFDNAVGEWFTVANLGNLCETSHTYFYVMGTPAVMSPNGVFASCGDLANKTVEENIELTGTGDFLHFDGDSATLATGPFFSQDLIFELVLSVGSATCWINGEEKNTIGDALPATTDVFLIGQEYDFPGGVPTPSNFYKGQIGEVIIYDRDVTFSERKQVERFLSDKWSIPLV